jgi:hypothetical protein
MQAPHNLQQRLHPLDLGTRAIALIVRKQVLRGLKFGLYSTPRCLGYQNYTGGSYDSPKGPILCSPQDVTEYAAWGVDCLKQDGDNPEGYETEATYGCLASAQRDIVYSLSNNAGCDPNGTHPAYYGRYVNAWRIGYDLSDAWSAILDNGFVGFDPGHGNMRHEQGFQAGSPAQLERQRTDKSHRLHAVRHQGQ